MVEELEEAAPFWKVVMHRMRKRTWRYRESKPIARAGVVRESRGPRL